MIIGPNYPLGPFASCVARFPEPGFVDQLGAHCAASPSSPLPSGICALTVSPSALPLMIACAVRFRAFFRGEALNEDTPILVPDTGEEPVALHE